MQITQNKVLIVMTKYLMLMLNQQDINEALSKFCSYKDDSQIVNIVLIANHKQLQQSFYSNGTLNTSIHSES